MARLSSDEFGADSPRVLVVGEALVDVFNQPCQDRKRFIAKIEARRGHATHAAAAAENAREHAMRLSGVRRMNHNAAYLEVGGVLSLMAGEISTARGRWEM
jgi:hypothetical protein